jgi:hypothetical protein
MPSSVSDNEEENTFMVSAADDIVEMIMARTPIATAKADSAKSHVRFTTECVAKLF